MPSTLDPKVCWRKSSFCQNGECIEFANLPDGGVALRAGGVTITCTQAEFAAFRSGVKAGECDDLTQ